MQQININELKSHPRNNEFFDDMVGDAWDSMIQSISTSGITNAITITEKNVIISGHQRVRACKVLGIEKIDYKLITYSNEEYKKQKDVKDLIESNLRQRVVGNANPIKLGRCFQFLNDWYGLEHGGDRKSNDRNCHLKNDDTPKNQSELANIYGIARTTMNNYMRLAKAIPELEDLVDTGIVSKDTALAMMRNLSEQEQKEFIESIPTDKKYTQKQMDEEIQKYKNRISELIQQGTKTEIVTQEVDKPETLNKIKDLEEKLDQKTKENAIMSSTLIEKEKMINEAIGSSTNYQLTSHCSEITLKMLNFVKDMAKYDYMAESFNEIPIATRIEYEKCIKSVKKWADRILETINEEKEIFEM